MARVGSWAMQLSPRSLVTDVYELSEEAPLRLLFELVIIGLVMFLLLRAPYNPGRTRLSKKEESALIDEWQPEPLLDARAVRNAIRSDEAAFVAERYVLCTALLCTALNTL